MKKTLIVILFIMLCNPLIAQFNLILNHSLEDTLSSAPCYGPIEDAKFWFNPQGATPDLYTYFPSYCTGVSSISNPNGFQLARTGNAYAGIYGFVSPTREYISVKLTDTLIQGACYYVEFYASLANPSRYAIDNLGCYFTNDTSGYKSITTNIPVIPQVINQPGNFLSDTMNWELINGVFTATGGEIFLLIGNFFDDQHTILDTVLPSSTWQAAYYYIDDVLVIPCDSLSSIQSPTLNNFSNIYPMPSSEFFFISNASKLFHKEKLKIYDMQGRDCTYQVSIEEHEGKLKIDIINLMNGIYTISLSNVPFGITYLKFIKE